MRVLTSIVALPLLLTAALAAQAQSSDTTLATGTEARFWSPDHVALGWLQGTVIRFFPSPGVTCLAVHTDALGGFVALQRIDSLQVRLTSAKDTAPSWRAVPVMPLRARESGCTR